jgi:N-acetylglucosaminyldiphosphoundecaprenol N-acetyl-beta-D-mannosaminyltransferase
LSAAGGVDFHSSFSQTKETYMPARKLLPSNHYRKILGVQFFVGNATQAVNAGMKGGLVVAPAAPSLLDLHHDRHYREALLESDLAITDSGFMVLLWNAMALDSIRRVSGLKYLKLLLSQAAFRQPGATFWVMPSRESLQRNLQWLQKHGVSVEETDCYVAPKYSTGSIRDEALLALLNSKRPAHVIVTVGGGVQERLGLFLKRHCDFQPAIHCIGAAIGFLTGDQGPIPEWADDWKLGWLFRCASNPNRFVPRYAKAFRLAMMMWRYRDQLPK